MRCCCCNRNLSDWETTAKHAITGAYLDTCAGCLKGSGIPVDARKDLDSNESVEDDEWFGDEEELE